MYCRWASIIAFWNLSEAFCSKKFHYKRWWQRVHLKCIKNVRQFIVKVRTTTILWIKLLAVSEHIHGVEPGSHKSLRSVHESMLKELSYSLETIWPFLIIVYPCSICIHCKWAIILVISHQTDENQSAIKRSSYKAVHTSEENLKQPER